jgi:tetratricopeptide (TPR) repeat protein
MTMDKVLVAVALVTILGQAGCAEDPLDRPRALYAENKLAEAYPLFAAVAEKNAGNAEAHAWLAETARRTGRFDAARDAARAAIAIDSCNAFALTVLGYLYQPIYGPWAPASADSAWHYYRSAVTCDPGDGNAWVGLWMEALRRGEQSWETRALTSLDSSGFLTPPVLAYNRWVLQTLPPHALLLTSGDWDTYPALALQTVEQVRPDVGIANLSLLNLPWYVRLVSGRYGLRMPFADVVLDRLQASGHLADSVVQAWRIWSLAGQLDRPLAAATTVGSAVEERRPGAFHDAGPYRLLTSDTTAAVDTSAMRRALADVTGRDFAGPEVSLADRSAIRMSAAAHHTLALAVLWTALRYSAAMLDAGDGAEAARALDWADAFVKDAGLGQEQREMVQHGRQRATQAAGDSTRQTGH